MRLLNSHEVQAVLDSRVAVSWDVPISILLAFISSPYYCRLGDLLCYTCMLYLSIFVCMHVNFVFSLFFVLFSFLASFSTLILLVGSFDL